VGAKGVHGITRAASGICNSGRMFGLQRFKCRLPPDSCPVGGGQPTWIRANFRLQLKALQGVAVKFHPDDGPMAGAFAILDFSRYAGFQALAIRHTSPNRHRLAQ
jgi:hypothetical protein